MCKLVNQIKSFFPKNTYFKRSLAIYLSIVFLCSITISVFLTSHVKNTLIESFSQTQKTFLNQLGDNVDTYVLYQIDSLTRKHFTPDLINDELTYFYSLKSADEADRFRTYRISNIISDLQLDIPEIDSIIIFNPQARISISSKNGIFYTDTWNQSEDICGFDIQMVNDFVENSELQTAWFSPEQSRNVYKTSNIATYIYKDKLPDSDANICVLFLLDSSNIIKQRVNDRQQNTLIGVWGSDDSLYAANDFSNPFWQSLNAENLDDGTSNGMTLAHDHCITWTTSNANDWFYIAATPIRSITAISSTVYSAVIITFLVMILCFLIAYASTVWLQQPIHRLLTTASRIGRTERVEIDLSDFNNAVDFLSNKVTNMEQVLVQNKALIQVQVVHDILNGHIVDTAEIISRLGAADVTFDYHYFAILVIDITPEVLTRFDAKKREYLFYNMTEQITRFFEKEAFCMSIWHKNSIITMMAFNQENLLTETDFSIFRFDGIANLLIGNAHDDIAMIRQDFCSIDKYLRYKFIYGYGNFFTSKDIDYLEASKKELDPTFIHNLEVAIKANAFDKARLAIDEIMEALLIDTYSYAYIQNVLVMIINTVCRNIKAPHNEILADFQEISNLNDFSVWIKLLLDSFGEDHNTQISNINREFIQKVVSYMSENISADLSLKTVAETFSISPNYLSKIFKESMNITFSAFLSSVKFDQAARMLIEEKSLNVTEIAERVGYFNMPYFNQQFKKKFGVSPLQYRKQNLK